VSDDEFDILKLRMTMYPGGNANAGRDVLHGSFGGAADEEGSVTYFAFWTGDVKIGGTIPTPFRRRQNPLHLLKTAMAQVDLTGVPLDCDEPEADDTTSTRPEIVSNPHVMSGDSCVVIGSGDYLSDVGYVDPDEVRTKFALIYRIKKHTDANNLQPVDIAATTRLSQSDILGLLNSDVENYTVWRLMKIVASMGLDVSITINDNGYEKGRITVDHCED